MDYSFFLTRLVVIIRMILMYVLNVVTLFMKFLHENCITSLITLVGSLFHAVDPPVGAATEEKIDNVEA